MADERSLHERLIELALFVPVGIAASVAEELPALAEKGRERLTNQLRVAKMVGQITVVQAKRKMDKVSGASAGGRTSSPGEPAPKPHTEGQPAKAPREHRPPKAAKAEEESHSVSRPEPGLGAPASAPSVPWEAQAQASPEDAPDVASLPIPGYDTLAASQVVQRLGSLRAGELDAVRRYEMATRGRRTILHRITQLSSADGRASA